MSKLFLGILLQIFYLLPSVPSLDIFFDFINIIGNTSSEMVGMATRANNNHKRGTGIGILGTGIMFPVNATDVTSSVQIQYKICAAGLVVE